MLILAEPISYYEVDAIKSGYEELSTAIQPFVGYQFSSGTNETTTTGEFDTLSSSKNVNEAITK